MTNQAKFGPNKSLYSRGQAAQYWRIQCSRWEKSGQIQAEFCRERRISLAALRWWRSELRRRDHVTQRNTGRPAFLPVRVVASSAPAALEVELRGGRVLRVRPDFDPLLLRKVVAALEDGQC